MNDRTRRIMPNNRYAATPEECFAYAIEQGRERLRDYPPRILTLYLAWLTAEREAAHLFLKTVESQRLSRVATAAQQAYLLAKSGGPTRAAVIGECA